MSMKPDIPATETSRADNAGTWREKESILMSEKVDGKEKKTEKEAES